MNHQPLPAEPPAIIGLAKLARMVFERVDLQPQWNALVERANADPNDAAALLDLATMLLLTGNSEGGLDLQAKALALQSGYRRPAEGKAGLKVLAVMTPGDMMANTPLDFLLAGSDIELISLYVAPGLRMPAPLPAHDVAFLAIGESEASRPLLQSLAPLMPQWPAPLLNGDALKIAALTRDGVCQRLAGAPQLLAPPAVRIDREGLARIAAGEAALAAALPDAAFPIIARPIGSHAGTGLEKLDDAAALGAYLQGQPGELFYISPFVDYASQDGLFRKQRIALIKGRPYVCHLAVSAHWMVHYLNAAMLDNAENRAFEARFMETFDQDFAVRHREAFAAMAERIGLDYFAIDCAETRDGRLLLFEADVAMIVHDMDPPDLFAYKKPQMRKVFDAFQAMLREAAGRI
ncbi:MAG: hypothetical protein P4L73_14465 [Caulobacteraceae bacterium]|nr:hypothetical protein [Caulobacteraceae bacterium]